MKNRYQKRIEESGNVLFLILIAVALFAALSYAVTQSSRSGSNDAGEEKSLISSAQVTQYPAGVRTSLVRMVIGGVDTSELYFNPPSDFGPGLAIDDQDADTTDESRSVFHPDGGGAPYQVAPPEILSGTGQQEWIFSPRWQIAQIGRTDATDAVGNDIVAFLPNVSRSICQRINEELGIPSTPDVDGDGIPPGGTTVQPTVADHSMMETPGYATPPWGGAPIAVIGTNDDNNGVAFVGQPFGCFDLDDGDGSSASVFVYYHVLIER